MSGERASVADPRDVIAIRACVSDYYDGYFDGDADRMARALHPTLAKRSVAGANVASLDREYMVKYTADGKGRSAVPENRWWDIMSLDIRGDIAAAVAVSSPFVDYLHLARVDDHWQIINVLWCDR